MLGQSSHSQFHPCAPSRTVNFQLTLLAVTIFISGLSSGCASVSAENSSKELAAAKISVIPSVVDFKNVVVGQKNSQSIKITNSGLHSITLESLQVSGTGFTLSSAKAPVELPPGKNLNVNILFAPASTSGVTGALVISSSNLKSPAKIPLSGSAEKAAPALSVSPSSLNFGTEPAKTSTVKTVTLTNTGNIALSITSINLVSSAFSVAGISKGVSLSPGQHLPFQVWFHPQAAGNASATVTLDLSTGLPATKLALAGSASNSTTSAPSASGLHSVVLDWTAGSSSAVNYHVYRSEMAGGPFQRINSGAITATLYKDSEVVGGGHYFYVVTALNEAGTESAYSGEVTADIPNP